MCFSPRCALLICPLILMVSYARSAEGQQIEKLIPDLMNRADVQGLSMAVIDSGHIVSILSFGVKSVVTSEKVDDRTVFEAASLGKPVFAYAVLKLVDQGKLDLDKPLAKYLPGYVKSDARSERITARNVLTHRTGFPNWRDGRQLVTHLDPGERFSYSGEGFVYLQRVVEKVTGKPLDEFMRRSVFVPLGMTDSSYGWDVKYEMKAAWGHDEADRARVPFKPVKGGSPFKNWVGGGPSAAFSLRTTARDYAKFAIALINGIGLKKETTSQMLSPQSQVDAGCSICIASPITHASETISWGLGIGLEETAKGRFFWHWGDNPGFKTFVVGSANSKRGVIVFTNSERGMMIIPDIVSAAMGEIQPAFNWIQYERFDSDRMNLDRLILEKGFDDALRVYRAGPAIAEEPMNSLGYQLLGQNKFTEAIRIFELNAAEYPNSSNAWNSLAEGNIVAGRAFAIEFSRKSLQLDPTNRKAAKRLSELEEQ